MSRTVIVGDVHGMLAELRSLIMKVLLKKEDIETAVLVHHIPSSDAVVVHAGVLPGTSTLV